MSERKVASGWTRVRWTAKMREGFLAALAESCNVKASAEAIGVRAESVYLLRRRDAAFREAWSAALAAGYEVLETRLVGRSLARESDADLDVELAIRLMTRHRNAMDGRAPQTGTMPRYLSREQLDDAILDRIDMLERARKAGAA